MQSVPKALSTIASLVLAAVVAFLVWHWIDSQRSRRALDVHLDAGKAYAAQALVQIGVLPDVLAETSGLAISRTQPGVLWSHNDSGDGPNVYAIDTTGRLLATVRVVNAAAVDWEDIAAGICPAGVPAATTIERPACLYLADTGDNSGVRPFVTVYVIAEPTISAEGPAVSSAEARSLRYRYPKGPEDAEGLAVLPDGDLTIVSKGRKGTIDFFGMSREVVARALASQEVLAAEYQGNTGIVPEPRIGRLATGAAISPDGTTLAVRTYYEVFFYRAVENGEGGRRWEDLGRPCFLGNAEPQGEGIDYLDEQDLLLTSERTGGRGGTLHQARC